MQTARGMLSSHAAWILHSNFVFLKKQAEDEDDDDTMWLQMFANPDQCVGFENGY